MNDKLKKTLGGIVIRHLTKITLGLGTLFTVVWQLRGDVDARELRILSVEQQADRIERRHTEDERARDEDLNRLRLGIARIERKTDAILMRLGNAQPLTDSHNPNKD